MNNLIDALIRSTQIAFIGLGILSLLDYARFRDGVRRDIALMFNSLAVTVAIGIINPLLDRPVMVLSLVASSSLIAQPFLLLRLVGYFRPIPRVIRVSAVVGMLASWAVVVIDGSSPAMILTLLIILYFIIINGYSMVAFIQGAWNTSGVVQHRLQFAASGSGLMALALFCLGLLTALRQPHPFIIVLTTSAAIGAALTFYLGLAAPKWLRQTWLLSELRQFALQMTRDRPPVTATEVQEALCRGALRVTGANRAAILHRHDAPQWTMIPHYPEGAGIPTSFDTVIDLKPYLQERSATAFVVRTLSPPLREMLRPDSAELMYLVSLARDGRAWGSVLVFLEHGSLFVDDDLQIISLFAEQSAIVLENIELLEHLRRYAESMERRVYERTAELTASEAKYRALIENAPDPIVISDARGSISLVNRRTEETFGYERGELIGQPIEILIPERLHDLHQAHRLVYMAESTKRAMGGES